MNSICLVTWNRLDYLKQVLQSLKDTLVEPYEIVIVDNNSDEETGNFLIDYCKENTDSMHISLESNFNVRCCSAAENFNYAMKVAKGDVLIHLDSDAYVPYKGWNLELEWFLSSHPEVGMVAPNRPGSHLRLHRPDNFDETDYVLGACFAIRKSEFLKYGGWNEELEYAYENDQCLRLRMGGFRVGMLTTMETIHLGDADTNVFNEGPLRGTFKFLKYWNEYFLGYFHYKSPLMLYWDDFPPNQMLRKMIFSEYGLNNVYDRERRSLQNHDCEIIKVPKQPGIYRENLTWEFVKSNKALYGSDEYDIVDKDLLLKKRDWRVDDAK